MQKQILIGVGGRFHADRMCTALSNSGFGVCLFSTLPRARFPGLSRHQFESYLWPEILYRSYGYFGRETEGAIVKMRLFGKYFARKVSQFHRPDVLVAWSCFGLEAFRNRSAPLQVLVRDSAHISEQIRILKEEYTLRGILFPDHTIVEERELEEYELADRILVLSSMAKRSFIERGISESKLQVMPLGADLSLFSPTSRRNSGPLKVVYFGNLSFQKGVPYLLEAMEKIPEEKASLTCIGAVASEMRSFLDKSPRTKVLAPMPHSILSEKIKEYDVFVFPSLHDGFGMVLPQAMASGLVPVVSSMVGASELVTHQKNGLVIPPGNTESIREAILSLSQNRALLEKYRENLKQNLSVLSWENYSQRMGQWFREVVAIPARGQKAA